MKLCIYALMLTLFLPLAVGACSNPADGVGVESTPGQTGPAADSGEEESLDLETLSSGGGDPRSAGYWLLWNSCAPDNHAEIAAANGGREAGWILMDDLLVDPGVLMGRMSLTTCAQGLHLLQSQDEQGENRGDDPIYRMASQLLATQLNLAAGAEYCPAIEEAVQKAQLLLVNAGFDGTSVLQNSSEMAAELDSTIDLLGEYNSGALCR